MLKKPGRNDACWCGSGRKYKLCHEGFDGKLQELKRKGYRIPGRHMIKTKKQIEGIRESGKINIAILDEVDRHIQAGMSTEEINRIVHETTITLGGIPAPLDYEGFPKSVCVSINEEVCHGIPVKERILADGDIVNVDVSTIYNGYFSDSSRMFCIGEVSQEDKKLVEITRESIQIGLDEVKPWQPIGNMGHAIHAFAMENGYTVVRDIGGHGVGLEFHEDPCVSYVTKPDSGVILAPGMIFTIEPMINMGTDEVYVDDQNGWTVYTDDGKSSAQWEVMVLVTDDGYEVLAY